MLLLDGRSDLYVTCVVAMVDLRQHTMVYANAGHPPGVLLSSGGGTRALGVGGPPLGLFPGAHYDEEPVTLESGDLVVLRSLAPCSVGSGTGWFPDESKRHNGAGIGWHRGCD